ncbi:hypothetical protein E2320_000162, partial [Naja naja]
MDDSNGPCNSRESFGLGKKMCPAIIVLDTKEENDEFIDELDEGQSGNLYVSILPRRQANGCNLFFSKGQIESCLVSEFEEE